MGAPPWATQLEAKDLISSREIDWMIYAYLKEAGLEHTAYTLLHESSLLPKAAQLEALSESNMNGKVNSSSSSSLSNTVPIDEVPLQVPPGHLVRMLVKGILFHHSEAHAKGLKINKPLRITECISSSMPLSNHQVAPGSATQSKKKLVEPSSKSFADSKAKRSPSPAPSQSQNRISASSSKSPNTSTSAGPSLSTSTSANDDTMNVVESDSKSSNAQASDVKPDVAMDVDKVEDLSQELFGNDDKSDVEASTSSSSSSNMTPSTSNMSGSLSHTNEPVSTSLSTGVNGNGKSDAVSPSSTKAPTAPTASRPITPPTSSSGTKKPIQGQPRVVVVPTKSKIVVQTRPVSNTNQKKGIASKRSPAPAPAGIQPHVKKVSSAEDKEEETEEKPRFLDKDDDKKASVVDDRKDDEKRLSTGDNINETQKKSSMSVSPSPSPSPILSNRNPTTAPAQAITSKNTHSKDVILLTGHQKRSIQMCAWNPLNPDGLASMSHDATLRIWEVPETSANASEQIVLEAKVICKHSSLNRKNVAVTSGEWDPSGSLIATGDIEGHARVWTPSGEMPIFMTRHKESLVGVKWNGAGTSLLTASEDSSVCLWNLDNGRVKQQWYTGGASVTDIEWHSDTSFACSTADGAVLLFNVAKPSPVMRFRNHADDVNVIRFSPDRTLIATAGDDGKVFVCGVSGVSNFPISEKAPTSRAEEIAALPGKRLTLGDHKAPIHSLEWLNNGPNEPRILVSGSRDGTARVWNVDTGSLLWEFRHNGPVYCTVFHPELPLLAVGSADGIMRIWKIPGLSSADTTIPKSLLLEYTQEDEVFDVYWNPRRLQIAISGPLDTIAVVPIQVD